jgi:hypothetical protein
LSLVKGEQPLLIWRILGGFVVHDNVGLVGPDKYAVWDSRQQDIVVIIDDPESGVVRGLFVPCKFPQSLEPGRGAFSLVEPTVNDLFTEGVY